MHLKILYFASARDAVGKKTEQLSINNGATLEKLEDELHSKHPGLKLLAKHTRYSINLEIVNDDALLNDGDEIGVLPAVAGG